MKLLDIIKTVGAGIIRETVPGGGLLLGVVNELLPADQQLPTTATGQQIERAVDSLPPGARAEVLNREFDVEETQIRESHSTVRTMLESDAKNPHSTRPYIAKQSFHVVAFVIIVAVSVWAIGIFTKDDDLIKTIMDGWQFILAAIGPLVTLLWAYFGVLKTEHKNRLDAANGSSTPSGLAGILSAITKRS